MSLKVALVHDYIKEYGGAERVLEAIHEIWPESPVYTSLYAPGYLGPHRDRFDTWTIKTSWLEYIPFYPKLISFFRIFSHWAFLPFDFKQFDVVIVSATGAYFPNSIRKKKAIQISYCHTPPRYLYGYATAREWEKHPLTKVIATVVNHFLRLWDFKLAQQVDFFIANSQEVKSRIKKFYRKNAVVIYPPVTFTQPNDLLHEKEDYFVCGGRLARAKHIDLIIEACAQLNTPLKVFGKAFAGYGPQLKKIAGASIEFVGEISDGEKRILMEHAKAYIFASEDEDFGITPVEAMALGTPVIAYRSGGVQETVIDKKTGIFFNTNTKESIIKAIKEFEKLEIDPKTCQKQAWKFSKERFQKEMKAFVGKVAFKKDSH